MNKLASLSAGRRAARGVSPARRSRPAAPTCASSPRRSTGSTPRRCSAARATSSTTASTATARNTCATSGSPIIGLDRAADPGQPDVRDRQDRRHDDGRDDAGRRRRRGSARAPPDLSVEARVRGSDWLYNYFLAFYRDDKSATGWNNLVFPNVAMPHVAVAAVGHEQAGRDRIREPREGARGGDRRQGPREAGAGGRRQVGRADRRLDPDAPGTMTPVAIPGVGRRPRQLSWTTWPSRRRTSGSAWGSPSCIYLGVLFVFAYWLKRVVLEGRALSVAMSARSHGARAALRASLRSRRCEPPPQDRKKRRSGAHRGEPR